MSHDPIPCFLPTISPKNITNLQTNIPTMGKDRSKKQPKLSERQPPKKEEEDEDSMDEEEVRESGGNAEEVASNASNDDEALGAVDGDDDDADKQDEEATETEIFQSDGRYRIKQRCLVLCSRGVTARYRHLLEDLRTLNPHHKKESKLDPGDIGMGRAINEIAEMKSCNTVLFLECRKRQDAYMWLGRVGGQSSGPSVKFHVSNIHTMDELRLTGNCMKGSRPV